MGFELFRYEPYTVLNEILNSATSYARTFLSDFIGIYMHLLSKLQGKNCLKLVIEHINITHRLMALDCIQTIIRL